MEGKSGERSAYLEVPKGGLLFFAKQDFLGTNDIISS